MKSEATTPDQYLKELPADRKEAFSKLRETVLKNLPKGFKEAMSYGMLTYVVPHEIYPAGYHCDPKQALPFVSIASQKNFLAFYHMGMYAKPDLLKWFQSEYPKHSATKLDMGKSCVRFKKPEQIPHQLIGELMKKMTVKDWIECYERSFTGSSAIKRCLKIFHTKKAREAKNAMTKESSFSLRHFSLCVPPASKP